MGIVKAEDFELVERPEIVIGLAAPVGTPLAHVQGVLAESLSEHGYDIQEIRVSNLIDAIEPKDPNSEPGNDYERLSDLMDRGTAAREGLDGGEVLAVIAASVINAERPSETELPALNGHAFIVRQFKHPGEVDLFRQIYGDAFHLIGVHCPESTRRTNLRVNMGMSEEQANDLIQRDLGEDQRLGQQLRDTFHLADVIVPLWHPDEADQAETEVRRYVSLLFCDQREGIPSPTPDEYGMFMAFSASLRSADLSRQVGAAILSPRRELLAVGCNEVPAAGGGQYWCDDPNDARDFVQGEDSNAKIRFEALEEILEALEDGFDALDEDGRRARVREVADRLGPARIMNLTEFGRAVHAEMDAILSAGRVGTSIRGADLYTTTYPCHNCAKHIVGAGVSRVVYIEPYPKSLALDLHDDAIRLEDGLVDVDVDTDPTIRLQSFVGVAPRRFASLFSMLSPDGRKYRRKDKKGDAKGEVAGLRTRAAALTYMQREAVAAAALKDYLIAQQQGELDL